MMDEQYRTNNEILTKIRQRCPGGIPVEYIEKSTENFDGAVEQIDIFIDTEKCWENDPFSHSFHLSMARAFDRFWHPACKKITAWARVVGDDCYRSVGGRLKHD